MRLRAAFEFEIIRARRVDTIGSEQSYQSKEVMEDLFNEIDIKNNCEYFQQIDNENAEFSHNQIIIRQLQARCMQGDYFKIVDTDQNSLFMRNLQILNQLANTNPISVLLNIQINQSQHLQGLWIGTEIAQTHNNINVIFCECYITPDFDKINIFLMMYSFLIADQLFITTPNNTVLNTFINYFKLIVPNLKPPFAEQLIICGLINNNTVSLKVDDQELSKYFNYIDFIQNYPNKLIEFEWLYFDFQQNMIRPIPIKIWNSRECQQSFQILAKHFIHLTQQTFKILLQYDMITIEIKDMIYDTIFQTQISQQLEASIDKYWKYVTKFIYPQMPTQHILIILNGARSHIFDQVYFELAEFQVYAHLKILLNTFTNKLNEREQQLLTYNDEIFECEIQIKMQELKNQFQSYNSISKSTDLENYFIDQFQLYNVFDHPGTDTAKFKSLSHFFQRQYPALLKDFLHKIESLINMDYDSKHSNFVDLLESLQERKRIQEQKAKAIINYNLILKNEIDNLKHILEQITYQIKSNQSQFRNTIKLEQRLTIQDSQIFTMSMQISKANEKIQRKCNKQITNYAKTI